LKVNIIVPAHNEEQVIANCLNSIIALERPADVEVEVLVVADRCTDSTATICRALGVKVLEKNTPPKSVDPITELFDLGCIETEGEIVGKVDADIILPKDWLWRLLLMIPPWGNTTASVSSRIKTRTRNRTSGWNINFFMQCRDLNYCLQLHEEPRGAARLMNRRLLNYSLAGCLFYYWPSWDTCLDAEIRKTGYLSLVCPYITALEYRPDMTLRKLWAKQVIQGRARKDRGQSFTRVLGHSLFRLRLGVLWGYFEERRTI